MKKAISVCVILLIVVSTLSTVQALADVSKMQLEVVEHTGEWETVTPMYLNATDLDDPVYARINATNINMTEPLEYLQFLHWIFNFSQYSEPELSDVLSEVIYQLDINFTNGIEVRVKYVWQLVWDIAGTMYIGYLDVWYDGVSLVDKNYYSWATTHRFEFYMWRSKSNQIIFQWNLGSEQDRAMSEPNNNWNVGNFSYVFATVDTIEMTFTCVFEDFGYLCGTNEGIADPVTNENWGMFEPLRQVLLFVLKLFFAATRAILPDELEAVFEHYIEKLGNYIDPVLEIMIWMGENWLDLLIIIHLFLLVQGVEKATKGELADVIMPFWNLWSGILGIAFKILNFVFSVIKAVISAIPFI